MPLDLDDCGDDVGSDHDDDDDEDDNDTRLAFGTHSFLVKALRAGFSTLAGPTLG